MGDNVKRMAEDYGYNSEFPRRLRALMGNRNNISPLNRSVTQSELARHLGVTRQAVSAYTSGASVPDMLRFKAIADYFQVSYAYLFGTTNIIKDEHKNLAEKAGLSPQTQAAILDICKTDNHAVTFMRLVESSEFHEIINTITAYLSICWTRKYDTDELLSLNDEIKEKTGGALRVVPAGLEKNMLIQNAQAYLAEAIREIDKKSDPTANANDGRVWRDE